MSPRKRVELTDLAAPPKRQRSKKGTRKRGKSTAERRKVDPNYMPRNQRLRKQEAGLLEMTGEQFDAELNLDMARFVSDPKSFVLYAFPWGVKGTTLETKYPRRWFLDLCDSIGAKLRANDGKPRDAWDVVQEAIASGHGIGKSAGFAMLIMWAMSTMEKTRGVVTANTETQLRTKTWPEVIKWHQLCITKHWFTCTATAIFHTKMPKEWRMDAIPWSATNTEAFAGLHNLGFRVACFYDEASAIVDPVWETTEGALTDEGTQILWLVAGNPTRASGRFRDCFGPRFGDSWGHRNIDSRTVEGTNKKLIARWARDYGENSQFFNVRVKGNFVSADPNQLIPLEWLELARDRAKDWDFTIGDGSLPVWRVSIDVASGGEDFSVLTVGQQWQSKFVLWKQVQFSFMAGTGATESADKAIILFDAWKMRKQQDDFVVDTIGVGDGTAGNLMKAGYRVVMFKGGAGSSNPKAWRNKRVQVAIVARNALRDGSIIIHPNAFDDEGDDEHNGWLEFCAQVASIKSKPGVEKLEDLMTKEEMIRSGIKSPDRAESFFMQFANTLPTIGVDQLTSIPRQDFEVIIDDHWDGYIRA